MPMGAPERDAAARRRRVDAAGRAVVGDRTADGPRRVALPVIADAASGPACAGRPAPVPARPRSVALPDLTADALPALLTAFYTDLAADVLVGPHFASIDMRSHVPRLADFWATVLFHAGRYHGSAFRPHLSLPGLTPAHFDRWLAALERAVDGRHAGPYAEQMKAAAQRIAYSMQLRLGMPPFGGDAGGVAG